MEVCLIIRGADVRTTETKSESQGRGANQVRGICMEIGRMGIH
jgi:hypothetical protein